MLIILEGNECNYKTTVANKLAAKLETEVVKGSTFEMAKCSNEELFEAYKKLAELDNVVVDRFLWSNLVYASIYDDYSILTLEQAHEIQRLIKDKAYLIYLYSDDDTLIERIVERGDEYVKPDKISSINKKYWEVLSDTLKLEDDTSEFKSLNGNMFNTKYNSSNEIVESVLKKVQQNV